MPLSKLDWKQLITWKFNNCTWSTWSTWELIVSGVFKNWITVPGVLVAGWVRPATQGDEDFGLRIGLLHHLHHPLVVPSQYTVSIIPKPIYLCFGYSLQVVYLTLDSMYGLLRAEKVITLYPPGMYCWACLSARKDNLCLPDMPVPIPGMHTLPRYC